MYLKLILILSIFLFFYACENKVKYSHKDNPKYIHEMDSISKIRAKKLVDYKKKYRMTSYDYEFHEEIAKNKPNFSILDSLLEKGANINSIHRYSISRKKISANIPIVKDFVKNTHENVWLEETPLLHKCIRVYGSKIDYIDYKVIKYLLEKGADPYLRIKPKQKITGNYRPFPLEVIINDNATVYPSFKSGKIVQKYVRLFKENKFNMDSLNLWCSGSNLNLINYLVKAGAPKKINIGLVFPHPPWQWKFKSNPSYFKKFNLDFSDVIIERSSLYRDAEELELLLSIGLSPNHKVGSNNMPLLFFVLKYSNNFDIFKKLIEVYNADITIKFQDENLLDFTKRFGKNKAKKYLEKLFKDHLHRIKFIDLTTLSSSRFSHFNTFFIADSAGGSKADH